MKKIVLNKYKNSIFNLDMYNDNELMGRTTIYPTDDSRVGALDINIDKSWQGRWLSNEFKDFCVQALKTSAKEFNLKRIVTVKGNPRGVRLLDFFGFVAYNSNIELYYMDV